MVWARLKLERKQLFCSHFDTSVRQAGFGTVGKKRRPKQHLATLVIPEPLLKQKSVRFSRVASVSQFHSPAVLPGGACVWLQGLGDPNAEEHVQRAAKCLEMECSHFLFHLETAMYHTMPSTSWFSHFQRKMTWSQQQELPKAHGDLVSGLWLWVITVQCPCLKYIVSSPPGDGPAHLDYLMTGYGKYVFLAVKAGLDTTNMRCS